VKATVGNILAIAGSALAVVGIRAPTLNQSFSYAGNEIEAVAWDTQEWHGRSLSRRSEPLRQVHPLW